MRYFFDTEFIEDGVTIDLVSIGIVAETGRTYYAESSEYNQFKANDYVRLHVLPQLSGVSISRKEMTREILEFIGADAPEFWAYYADYDWVALCQLFGPMHCLPRHWPMYCRDLKQLIDEMGSPQIRIRNEKQHHALSDARWCKDAYEFLKATHK